MLLEAKDAKIADLEERIARPERLISRNGSLLGGQGTVPRGTTHCTGWPVTCAIRS